MNATTLVILAAGMGSRYGGLKQIEPVTAEGDIILDFSIYDAVQTGFRKIVFVVRREILDDFKRLFAAKLEGIAEQSYVCQDEADPVKGRTKPYGTGHAVLSARDMVTENFCTINADDFYGRGSFETARKWSAEPDSTEFSMIGFTLQNTLSASGTVSRGQCVIDNDGFLQTVIEQTGIFSENGVISSDGEGTKYPLTADTVVSMNFWMFTPVIFEFLERDFRDFREREGSNEDAEFYINDVVNRAVAEKLASVRAFPSDENWMGITYRDDRGSVAERILELREAGIYPSRLW